MKMLRCLVAIVFACGLASVARADDFQMVVIDPVPSASEVHLVTTDDFTVSLSPCQSNQLDGLSTSLYLGCFTGLNVSGAPLTSLQLLIPVFDVSPDVLDTPGCAPVSQDIFTAISCGTTSNGLDYYVDFSGGDIPTAVNHGDCDYDGDAGHLNQDDINCDTASIFTIAVGFGTSCTTQTQCQNEINTIDTAFTDVPVVANAPEPSSLWLMSTGVLSVGLFGAYRCRHMVPLSPPRL